MACRTSRAASIGPIFLRLALGIIFIWAGLGKVLGQIEVKGDDVAVLTEMGLTPAAPSGGDPAEIEVPGAHVLALTLKKAAQPPGGDAARKFPLWPPAFAQGHWPKYWAYACTVTELVGGALLLIGALTRLSAFALACVMLTALWLTQIGPAVQSGDTWLGFLPNRDLFSMGWEHFQIQFILLAMALCLLFTGCGKLGLDCALFGGRPPAARPKPEPAQ
jgi:uncharacterized membrane protein YphA (DoxX/SURF4 family)